MTFLGFLLLVFNFVMFSFYDLYFTEAMTLPSWIWLVAAICQFCSHQLGMSASMSRRLNVASTVSLSFRWYGWKASASNSNEQCPRRTVRSRRRFMGLFSVSHLHFLRPIQGYVRAESDGDAHASLDGLPVIHRFALGKVQHQSSLSALVLRHIHDGRACRLAFCS